MSVATSHNVNVNGGHRGISGVVVDVAVAAVLRKRVEGADEALLVQRRHHIDVRIVRELLLAQLPPHLLRARQRRTAGLQGNPALLE